MAICRLSGSEPLPAWALEAAFLALTRTATELSIVCPAQLVPQGVLHSAPWRRLRVQGVLEFAATGILASLAQPLAQAEISIFALSTYDTDYLLVRSQDLARAVTVLRQAGHSVAGDAT